MTTTYQAKISHVTPHSAPDDYDPSLGLHPSDNFVVARDVDGKTLSTYGDLTWDRSPYGGSHETYVLYFDYWRERWKALPKEFVTVKASLTPQRTALVREIHWLMFIVIYLRPGNGLSNGTLAHYCCTVRALARLAESRSTSIERLLSDADTVKKFANSSSMKSRNLVSLLTLLKWLGHAKIGLAVVPNDVIDNLKVMRRDYQDEKKTPPLPTRIYSHVLSALSKEIKDFEEVADRILTMLAACVEDPALGRDSTRQYKLLKLGMPFRPQFSEILEQYQLEEFWKKKGYKLNFKSMSTALTEMMGTCMLQIQAFTGMRHHEAEGLPHNCIEEVTLNGEVRYLVRGRVTKLTGGKAKPVRWVTSEAGHHAILLAQRISRTLYKLVDDKPKNRESTLNEHFLFISPMRCLVKKDTKIKPANLNLSTETFKRLRSLLQTPIAETELAELVLIEPERNWRDEANFQVGQPWVFTTHQLRRSLALYAHASGFVSLPSLKRQLQHITREMSLYYASGSAFAMDFIVRANSNERHIGEDWQKMQWESQYLGHMHNVEMGDPNELAGAYSIWFDRNMRNTQLSCDRKTTMREYEQGKRAYRETFAGGCTKVGACDQRMNDPLNLECLLNECRHQVIKLPKFERIIRIQISVVENLEKMAPELPETRAELDILAKMRERMDKILQAKKSITESVKTVA